MSEHNDYSQINLEYRAIVLGKLNSLEAGQIRLAEDIVTIKTSFVQQEELYKLRDKVDHLENFKFRLLGSLITLQVVLSVVGYILTRLIK